MSKKRVTSTSNNYDDYFVNDYYYNNTEDTTTTNINDNYYDNDVQELLKEIHSENNNSNNNDNSNHINNNHENNEDTIQVEDDDEDDDESSIAVIPIVNSDNDDSSVEMNTNNRRNHHNRSKKSIASSTIRAESNLLLHETNSTSGGAEEEEDYVGIANLECVGSCFASSSTKNNNDIISSSSVKGLLVNNNIVSLKETFLKNEKEYEDDNDEHDNNNKDVDGSTIEGHDKNKSRHHHHHRRRRAQRKKSNSITSTISQVSSNITCNEGGGSGGGGDDNNYEDKLLKESELNKFPTTASPIIFHNLSSNNNNDSKGKQQQQSHLHGYFDSNLLSSMKDGLSLMNKTIQEMALDNRIFLRTVLTLLSEYNITINNDIGSGSSSYNNNNQNQNNTNILKTGPLKKYSHLSRRWKVKFVEVRYGMLSYYEDELPSWIDNIIDNHHHNNEQQNNNNNNHLQQHQQLNNPLLTSNNHNNNNNKKLLNRKDIPLNKRSITSCRILDSDHVPLAVNNIDGIKNLNNTTADYVFELLCQEDSDSSTCMIKKIWMAYTKEERKSWMDAIRLAMEKSPSSSTSSSAQRQQQQRQRYNNAPFIPNMSSNYQWNAFLKAKTHSQKIPSPFKTTLVSSSINNNASIQEKNQLLCEDLFNILYHHKLYSINLDWWLLYTNKNSTTTTSKHNENKNNINNDDNPQQFEVEEYFIPNNNNNNNDNIKDTSLIWKLLSRKHTIIIFNGTKFYGYSPFVVEQVFGSITRCMMEIVLIKLRSCVDNNNVYTGKVSNIFQNDNNSDDYRIDIQAIIFARDIILSACKYLLLSSSSSSNNSNMYQSAVHNLLTSLFNSPFIITPITHHEYHRKNKIIDISITTPSSYNNNNNNNTLTSLSTTTTSKQQLKLLHEAILTSPKNQNDVKKKHTIANDNNIPNTKSGWIMTRMKNNKRYKKRYCILSDNVLSFYEYDTPRPNGLKSQIVLTKDSSIQISTIRNDSAKQKCYIITIFTNKDKIHRQFQSYFNNDDDYLSWKASFHSSISLLQQKYNNNKRNNKNNNNKNHHHHQGKQKKQLKTKASNMIREKLQQHRGTSPVPSTAITYNGPTSPCTYNSVANTTMFDSPKTIATKKKQLQALLKKGRSSQENKDLITMPPPPAPEEVLQQEPIAQIAIKSLHKKYKIVFEDDDCNISKGGNNCNNKNDNEENKNNKKSIKDEQESKCIIVQTNITQYYFLYNDNTDNGSNSNNGCYMLKGEEIICLEFS